jgi:hypothetical protein
MDWFKMQTVWGASIERFSDAEAGRFIKAVYAYVRHGEEYDGGSGREDPVIWQALETLRKDVESFKRSEANQKAQEEALKEKRRAAAKARWGKQNDASASKCMQNDASASGSTICIASASQNKNKNFGNVDKDNTRAREDMPFGLTDDDIQASLDRRQQLEDAARSIGLQVTEAGMMYGERLVQEYGLEKVLDAIKKAVDVPKWAYVEGICKGKGVKPNDNHGDHGTDSAGTRRGKYSFLFDGTEAV